MIIFQLQCRSLAGESEYCTVFLVSVLKWLVLASFVGIIVGAATAIFLKTLAWSTGISNGNSYYFLLLPAAFFLSSLMWIWKPLKGIIGGLALIAMTLVFSTRYLGLDLDTIAASLDGESVTWYAFLLKAVFTSLTLGFGGSGGIVTPIFFIGSTAGVTFAQVLGLDLAFFAAIGFVSLLAGAANTPLAAGIMAIELFGPAIAPYAVVACAVSFLITGHRSVYPSQRLATEKSTSIKAGLGKEIRTVRPRFQPREKSVLGLSFRLWNIIRNGSRDEGDA